MRRRWLPIAATFMVLFGLARMPYGYYMLLRLGLCAASIYYISQVRPPFALGHRVVLSVFAVLYNPLIPIHLRSKAVWIAINVATALHFWLLASLRNRRQGSSGDLEQPDSEQRYRNMNAIRRFWSYVSDVAANTRRLKGAIVLAFAFGGGLATFGLGGRALVEWWASRPRPWIVGPVTAQFEHVDVYQTAAGAQDLVFIYSLRNNTASDLYLASEDMRVAAKYAPDNALLGLNAVQSLALDSPIFVPAQQRTRVRVMTGWTYDGSSPLPAGRETAQRKARHALLTAFLRDQTAISGFVLFHRPTRYQIELPNGWAK